MSEQPYAVGTRLLVEWPEGYQPPFGLPQGLECLAGDDVIPSDGSLMPTGMAIQLVHAYGVSGYHPVAWLRPIQDPDAEPVESEREVTA